MPDNKQIIRSPQVQQVMNHPPGLLIVWGNVLVIGFFFLAFLLVNTIKIPNKKTVPVKMQLGAANRLYMVPVEENGTAIFKMNQMVTLKMEDDSLNPKGYIHAHVSGVEMNNGQIAIYLNKLYRNDILLTPEKMEDFKRKVGEVTVIMGYDSFYDLLRRKIHL